MVQGALPSAAAAAAAPPPLSAKGGVLPWAAAGEGSSDGPKGALLPAAGVAPTAAEAAAGADCGAVSPPPLSLFPSPLTAAALPPESPLRVEVRPSRVRSGSNKRADIRSAAALFFCRAAHPPPNAHVNDSPTTAAAAKGGPPGERCGGHERRSLRDWARCLGAAPRASGESSRPSRHLSHPHQSKQCTPRLNNPLL